MTNTDVLPPYLKKAYDAYQETPDYKKLTEQGWNYNTIRGRVSEANRLISEAEPPVSLPEMTWLGQTPQYTTPVFDGWGRYEVDNAIVCGDVHIPCTDWSFAERMCDVADAQGIDTLFVIGDFWNADALGRWDHLAPPAPLAVELDMGARLVMRWRQIFKRIVFRIGNHDARWLKLLQGGMSADMMHVYLDATQGVEYAPYGQVEIVSGGQLWRATHQANYSKIKTRVGSVLANKFGANIMSFHQHHVSVTRDEWNRYTTIDCGGLFDSRKFAYVNLFDNTSPVMNQGFVVLRNGTGHLLTPYETMTDWSMWL